MRQQLKFAFSLAVMGIVLVACGTGPTREATEEDKIRNEFKVILAKRQVARRQETALQCARKGVYVPDTYEQKGGGMLEEYVDGDAPPCGLTAQERIQRAEADFRGTWKDVVAKPVPREYEWLLAVKSRIAVWLDAGGLTPDEARAVLREAQWILAGWDESDNSERGSSSGAMRKYYASLDTALNRALATEGIACRKDGTEYPCF